MQLEQLAFSVVPIVVVVVVDDLVSFRIVLTFVSTTPSVDSIAPLIGRRSVTIDFETGVVGGDDDDVNDD